MQPSPLILYQPLLVGLGAVVLGLIANTLLEWLKQNISSNHKRTTLRRAIYVELNIILDTLRHNLKEKDDPPRIGQYSFMPIREIYPAWEHSLDHLGLFTETELAAIIEAYDYLHAWPEIMALIGHMERREGRLFGRVPAENYDHFIGAISDRYEKVGVAVSAIGKHLRTSKGRPKK